MFKRQLRAQTANPRPSSLFITIKMSFVLWLPGYCSSPGVDGERPRGGKSLAESDEDSSSDEEHCTPEPAADIVHLGEPGLAATPRRKAVAVTAALAVGAAEDATALGSQVGVVGWRADAHRAGAAAIGVAQVVREGLELVSCELVLVQEDVVVRRADGALI